MKAKKITLFTLVLVVAYFIYELHISTCKPNQMQITDACSPVRSAYTAIYRRLNCFCDDSHHWKKLGVVISRLNYYRDVYGKKYPENIFGIKDISCYDDELQADVFDDDDVFLYIEQDTAKVIYDGGLKKMSIGNVRTDKIGILDVGIENRKVSSNIKKDIVQYLLDYDELDSRTLIKFQQAIHHDSTYQKQFKNVEYQLINKETSKHEASIRYEDFGERFYLDVF
jgi:hypothetical protein